MARVVPAEWSPHRAVWLGFPSHAELWERNLAPAQEEAAALARALAEAGGERVRVVVGAHEALASAHARLRGVQGVEVLTEPFGDVWLRDTGPIFLEGGREAAAFAFNGWGGKYRLAGDDDIADRLATRAGVRLSRAPFVLEGGAVDHDGRGLVLTTRECLLNPNRNPGWTESAAEAALRDALGVRRVIWLGDGLRNDHTDGHVDNLARFVAPGVVVCPLAVGRDDPNAVVYDDTARSLASARDLAGAPLRVVRIPSPGRIEGPDGEPVPASHMNFVIANSAVIVPTFGGPAEALALQAFESLFPDRAVIGLPSRALLTGGGSFHCVTQQEPL